MNRRTILRAGLLLWTVVFMLSFVDAGPGGGSLFGFGFLVWQLIAGGVAAVVWWLSRPFEKKSAPRVAGRIPIIIFIALALAFGLYYVTVGAVQPAFSEDLAPVVERSA